MQAQQLRGSLNAVETGQSNIHENNVGTLQLADLDRFGSVFGFGHLVIIDEEYVKGHKHVDTVGALPQESAGRPGSTARCEAFGPIAAIGQLNLIIVSRSPERVTVRAMPLRSA
jgi:hypothetical protein